MSFTLSIFKRKVIKDVFVAARFSNTLHFKVSVNRNLDDRIIWIVRVATKAEPPHSVGQPFD